jgi:hypothetical protein
MLTNPTFRSATFTRSEWRRQKSARQIKSRGQTQTDFAHRRQPGFVDARAVAAHGRPPAGILRQDDQRLEVNTVANGTLRQLPAISFFSSLASTHGARGMVPLWILSVFRFRISH